MNMGTRSFRLASFFYPLYNCVADVIQLFVNNSMPKVTFEDDDIAVDVENGANLKDIAEDAGATIPFGCEQGICGTCLSVVEGEISDIEENEQETLEAMGAEPGQRLACQCQVQGDVTVKSAY
jgi:ferredoxin